MACAHKCKQLADTAVHGRVPSRKKAMPPLSHAFAQPYWSTLNERQTKHSTVPDARSRQPPRRNTMRLHQRMSFRDVSYFSGKSSTSRCMLSFAPHCPDSKLAKMKSTFCVTCAPARDCHMGVQLFCCLGRTPSLLAGL